MRYSHIIMSLSQASKRNQLTCLLWQVNVWKIAERLKMGKITFYKASPEKVIEALDINLRQRMTPTKKMKKTIFWESSWPRKAALGRSKKRKAKPRKARHPKRWLLE